MKIDHVKILLPEPEKASAFYQRVFGLIDMGSKDNYILLSSHPADGDVSAGEVWIGEGSTAKFESVAIGVEDLEPWREKVRNNPALGTESDTAVTIKPPAAHTVEILQHSERVSKGESKSPFHITKLGHVTFRDPNSPEVYKFYTNELGFRLSDQYEDVFFWMRCNEDHHTVAVAPGKASGLHHIAFELGDWNDVKLMCDHFASEGFRLEAGPGRHGPGNNIFTYAVDPFGIRWEFFCEMNRIYDEENYVPKIWRGERSSTSTNIWGVVPPDSYFQG